MFLVSPPSPFFTPFVALVLVVALALAAAAAAAFVVVLDALALTSVLATAFAFILISLTIVICHPLPSSATRRHARAAQRPSIEGELLESVFSALVAESSICMRVCWRQHGCLTGRKCAGLTALPVRLRLGMPPIAALDIEYHVVSSGGSSRSLGSVGYALAHRYWVRV